ncbi:MAG: 4-hydroxy-tetrahydrodipicolinate synthase [Saprospiraceae bacterium]|nr:4-hydroxy-tetrahydrodipicolinate synthase [Saprospiraceae bacterium]MBK9223157.1 4-hydroxy-tetrahydrodipicolinate synthase [Saprospiraceae bacterium]MBK9720687.1 4-hydroxy-tetrahydrodipicolinate synthase [Saprospiraceae bacterium]MBK9727676.1 4-hydroxy-tetrahydrodipicolinate synthase [Saprospiraceae bacterium]
MKSNYSFLKGTGVALITPFDANGQIKFEDLSKIIEHCIAGGVDYLVSMGTTGESATLSYEERISVIQHTIKISNNRIPVVAGFGGNNTLELVKEIQILNTEGISAILSSSPAYNKPSQEGIFQHYMEIAEHSPLPIIIYNVPGRTASNILPETTLRLAHASSKFAAVKEASGDLTQATKIIKEKPDHFLVLSGDDPLALGLIGIGGDGVISVIANIYPKLFSDMIRFAMQGNFSEAQEINLRLFDLHKWLYIDGNPAGVKAGAHYLGLCENIFRLPLVQMTLGNFDRLKKEMDLIN